MMLTTSQAIREYARRAVRHLPIDQTRFEVRYYAWLVTTVLALLLIEPIFYFFFVPDAPIAIVSKLVRPSPLIVGAVFAVGLACVLPHWICLSFYPRWLSVEWPRIAAGAGSYVAGAMWIYLAWKAYPLDFGLLWVAYLVRMLIAALVGLAMGYSVNAQQVRACAAG